MCLWYTYKYARMVALFHCDSDLLSVYLSANVCRDFVWIHWTEMANGNKSIRTHSNNLYGTIPLLCVPTRRHTSRALFANNFFLLHFSQLLSANCALSLLVIVMPLFSVLLAYQIQFPLFPARKSNEECAVCAIEQHNGKRQRGSYIISRWLQKHIDSESMHTSRAYVTQQVRAHSCYSISTLLNFLYPLLEIKLNENDVFSVLHVKGPYNGLETHLIHWFGSMHRHTGTC